MEDPVENALLELKVTELLGADSAEIKAQDSDDKAPAAPLCSSCSEQLIRAQALQLYNALICDYRPSSSINSKSNAGNPVHVDQRVSTWGQWRNRADFEVQFETVQVEQQLDKCQRVLLLVISSVGVMRTVQIQRKSYESKLRLKCAYLRLVQVQLGNPGRTWREVSAD